MLPIKRRVPLENCSLPFAKNHPASAGQFGLPVEVVASCKRGNGALENPTLEARYAAMDTLLQGSTGTNKDFQKVIRERWNALTSPGCSRAFAADGDEIISFCFQQRTISNDNLLTLSNRKLLNMARDKYHEHVRNALLKNGWTITHDPYRFKYLSSKDQEIDLGAGRNVIGAIKGKEKIAVEVKSFLDDSVLQDLYKAFGQYLIYFNGLEEVEPDRILYLAMPEEVMMKDFDQDILTKLLKKYDIKVMVFSILEEKILNFLP